MFQVCEYFDSDDRTSNIKIDYEKKKKEKKPQYGQD